MSVFDDIKKKATELVDQNGDGKVDKGDFDTLKNGDNKEKFDSVKSKADLNGDGKVDMSDLKNIKDKFLNK